jgi:hypothetical protein
VVFDGNLAFDILANAEPPAVVVPPNKNPASALGIAQYLITFPNSADDAELLAFVVMPAKQIMGSPSGAAWFLKIVANNTTGRQLWTILGFARGTPNPVVLYPSLVAFSSPLSYASLT